MWASHLVTHTHTLFPLLFPFAFLCHPILPNLSLTGFLPVMSLSHSLSDFPTFCSLRLPSHRPLSVSLALLDIPPIVFSVSHPVCLSSVSASPSPSPLLSRPFYLPTSTPHLFLSLHLSYSLLVLSPALPTLSVQSRIQPVFGSTPQCGLPPLGSPLLSPPSACPSLPLCFSPFPTPQLPPVWLRFLSSPLSKPQAFFCLSPMSICFPTTVHFQRPSTLSNPPQSLSACMSPSQDQCLSWTARIPGKPPNYCTFGPAGSSSSLIPLDFF